LRADKLKENGTEDDYETKHDRPNASGRKAVSVAAVRPI